MESVRAHPDRKSQALVLMVSEMPCLGLLEKPGPFLSESQTQVTVLPFTHGLTHLLPAASFRGPTAAPMALFISLGMV